MIDRRGFLLLGAAAASRAERIEYRDYSRVLPDFLSTLARDAYERRNQAIARLTTPAAIRARQQWVRETFWRLVGGMPERTPLSPRTTGAFERDGYRVEKLIYQSRPGLFVPANLYLPKSAKPPYPGVLFQMGHSGNGKAAEPYQKCCQGLARLGYIVLAFDPMGQGERAAARIDSADAQHTIPGRQMLLAGDTATRLQVWDAVRSLDALAAHPLVDPKRLASTGQSGGGTLTMLLMAVDDRLAAAAVSCGNTENYACANYNPPGSTDDAEQNFIASAPAAFDRWDLLYPIAPKPLLVLASARDFFGTYSPRYLTSGREEFEKLAKAYAVMGAADRIAWDETPAPHALAYYLRTRIYAWFERWLRGRAVSEVMEPPVAPERDEVLHVGATGNVVRDFASKTPLILTRERAASLKPGPADLASLKRLLAVGPPSSAAVHILRRIPSERCDISAIEVGKAPAYLFTPHADNSSKPVLLIADPRGRASRWAEGGLYHQLAAAGCPVCAVDVTGVGDLSPELSRGAQRYAVNHANDESYAWASLILGRPLIGQRVDDMAAFARALSAHLPGRRIVLVAEGSLAVPALFATAFEPRISRAWLAGCLLSYRSLLDVAQYKQPTANFIPNILAHADLPAVAALAAPRRITLAGTVDGNGAMVDSARVRALYPANVDAESLADLGQLTSL